MARKEKSHIGCGLLLLLFICLIASPEIFAVIIILSVICYIFGED